MSQSNIPPPEEPIGEHLKNIRLLSEQLRQKRLSDFRRRERVWVILGVVLGLISGVATFFFRWKFGYSAGDDIPDSIWQVVISLAALVGAIVIFVSNKLTDTFRVSENNERRVEVVGELTALTPETHEQKAQKLLELSQDELQKYYAQALGHSKKIFWIGVVAMGVGLAIVGWAMWFATQPPHSGTDPNSYQEKIIVAVLGGVGGILANFVGALYIKMFSETVSTVNNSFSALNETQHYHTANLLASMIQDQSKREDILGQLALAMRPQKAP